MKKTRKINWLNLFFLTLTPLVGIVGMILLLIYSSVAWQTWVLAVALAAIGNLSITAGYHRLFSHSSYKSAWPVRLFFALFGAATFEGSILEWSTDHRNHHRYTDTDRDPYSIKGGFWYAHMGWLFTLDPSKRDYSNVEDLQKDPIVWFQHRFYIPIAIFMGFVLPMMIGALWGNALAGLIIAGALRIGFNEQTTFCINSVCHYFGKKTYSDEQSARDNWFTALFTFGEGYHNFHHQFPIDYRNGIRFYDYDPTKWLIKLLEMCGLASDLKTVSQHRIIRYKVRREQKALLQSTREGAESIINSVSGVVKPMYDKITSTISRIDELEKAYAQLKKMRFSQVKIKMPDYREKLTAYRKQLKAARRELKVMVGVWTKLTRLQFKMIMRQQKLQTQGTV